MALAMLAATLYRDEINSFAFNGQLLGHPTLREELESHRL